MSWDDLSQSRTDWPTIRECHAYRRAAYDIIIKLLEVWAVTDFNRLLLQAFGACACARVWDIKQLISS